ncbi:hypothetical protein NM688_g7277 [Phlebia brevispora]|uniref:Uncharacterized protein n=1 Tax=Phlebia brevispora TaxID=194682 RepID=A0ACC1S795_9APHY|nr:hypothetical protein NM688_g7277 [Phlebia brevispora]
MKSSSNPKQTIWWANAAFFIAVHLGAIAGIYYHPLRSTSWKTLCLTFALYETAMLSITVGYHRLYSHKSFRAGQVVSAIVAFFGASACQGSIKWWALRHRLHHRYTDDLVHDPYAATRGMLWAHVGWIFYKTEYERMSLINREDLDKDKVVVMQHEYYIPITATAAFVVPVLIGSLWDDAAGAFVWAALFKCVIGAYTRILQQPVVLNSGHSVWHSTFLINSAAHWNGVQPYSDEDTSRTNLILAILTNGEGNHNFHAFPHDFRSGPTPFEWDPTKWLIMLLHAFGLATNLRRARQEDLNEAKLHMKLKAYVGPETLQKLYPDDASEHPLWTLDKAQEYAASASRCLIIIDEHIMDVTAYLKEHPGGAAIIRKYSLRKPQDKAKDRNHDEVDPDLWKQATWAFSGGLNTHSRAAKRRLQGYTIAKLAEA